MVDKSRILKNIKLKKDCWIWQGCKKKTGYGYMTIGSRTDGTRKTITSHRASYMAFNGEIKNSLWVLHKCDVRECVNPSHLYLGTRKDNVTDMMKRGRSNHAKGERCGMSKLTYIDAINIRLDRINNKTPYRKIAINYGLKSHKTVMQICKGDLWKHLPIPEPPINEK